MILNSNKHHEHGNMNNKKFVTHRGLLCPWNTCITKTLNAQNRLGVWALFSLWTDIVFLEWR